MQNLFLGLIFYYNIVFFFNEMYISLCYSTIMLYNFFLNSCKNPTYMLRNIVSIYHKQIQLCCRTKLVHTLSFLSFIGSNIIVSTYFINFVNFTQHFLAAPQIIIRLLYRRSYYNFSNRHSCIP